MPAEVTAQQSGNELSFDCGSVARGDIMIKLFSVTDLLLTRKVDCIARLIFHTGFIGPSTASLTFRKHDIDVLEKNKAVPRELEFKVCFDVDADATLDGVDAGLWDQDRFEKFQRVAQENRAKATPFSHEVIPPKMIPSSSSQGSDEFASPVARSDSPSLAAVLREDHIGVDANRASTPVLDDISSTTSEQDPAPSTDLVTDVAAITMAPAETPSDLPTEANEDDL